MGYTNWWSHAANWYAGVDHPWLEDNMPLASMLMSVESPRWKWVGSFTTTPWILVCTDLMSSGRLAKVLRVGKITSH